MGGQCYFLLELSVEFMTPILYATIHLPFRLTSNKCISFCEVMCSLYAIFQATIIRNVVYRRVCLICPTIQANTGQ